MSTLIREIEQQYKKHQVVDVKSGDTVKVHQKIKEGNKERVQIFEGLVIRTGRKNSHTSTITVRRISSGIGVEKSYLLHSPLVLKVEVVKRSKVRRNYLSYMRQLTGKSARLTGVDFNKEEVNKIDDNQPDVAEVITQQENVESTESESVKNTKDLEESKQQGSEATSPNK